MAQLGTPYVIPLGTSGMVAHPNRWQSRAGEVTLAENVVVENDVLQKDPAAVYYDPVGIDALSAESGVTVNDARTIIAAWLPALASTARVANILRTSAISPGTPWNLTVTAGAASGLAFIIAVSREAGTGGPTQITDARGNTYTQIHTLDGNGIRVDLWGSLLTTALQTGDAVTVTLSNGASDVIAIGITYSGVISVTPVARAQATAAAVNFIATGTAHSHRYPLLGLAATARAGGLSGGFDGPIALQNVNDQLAGANHGLDVGSGAPYLAMRILGQVEWDPDATSTGAGTASASAGARTVTGVGTSFTTLFRPGDDIIIEGERQIVSSITSNTVLNTVDPWHVQHTAVAYVRRAGPVLLTYRSMQNLNGTITTPTIFREAPTPDAHGIHGDLDATTILTNLQNVRPRFVIGGKEISTRPRRLFMFNGADPVFVLVGDGTTMSVIGNPNPDWSATANPERQPINGIVHQDSLVGFGNLNDPHRLYFSTTTDHEDFRTVPPSDGFTLKIASQIGERLYGAAQYQGVLFLWKHPNGIFYVDDTPADRLQWGYRVKSAALGCAPSPFAVLSIDDDVLFMDPHGHFHLLSAVQTLGGTRDSDLTRMLGLHKWTRDNVYVPALDRLMSVYDPRTKTAWFGCQSVQGNAAGGIDNDLLIRWDFASHDNQNPAPRMTTSRAWLPNSLCLKRRDYIGVPAIMIGEIGDSWLTDPDAYGSRTNWDFIGAAEQVLGVPTRVTLPDLDFGDRDPEGRVRRKTYRAISLITSTPISPSQLVQIEMRVDGTLRQTVPVQLGVDREPHITTVSGSGYTIEFTITTDGSVIGDLPIIGLTIFYDLTGQKPVE